MEVQDISKLLNTNIDKLKNPKTYKNILFKGNNLLRFDILNRILIELQFENSFDIRTYNEWIMEGRQVYSKNKKSSKVKPIHILMPRYEHKYIDIETGDTLDMQELNVKEFNKAIEYNLIKKDTQISDLYTIPMYDITQTEKHDASKGDYIVNKPVLSSSDIINMASDIMGCQVEVSNLKDLYFNSNTKTLFVNKLPYEKLITSLSKIISKFYINYKIIEITDKACEINYLDLTDFDIDLIDLSIQYSMNTLLSGDSTYSSKKLDEILSDNRLDNSRIVDILNIVDTVVFDIARRLKFTKEFSMDAINNVHKIRKANMLLSEMEANELSSIINEK